MKLDLCICETLSYTSVPWKPICGCGYRLPLSQYLKIYHRRRKMTVARYQTCYTNSVVCMKVSGRTGSLLQYSWKMPKIINIGQRRDTTHTTEATPTTSLPSSRKFLYFLTVSNPSSHYRLFCLVFFCSASTQTVLMRTVGTTEYKDHLNLKRSTTNGNIKTTLLCPTDTLQAGEFFHQDLTTI